MDYESSNTGKRLEYLELKSDLMEHILNRLRYLTDLKEKEEHTYCENLGRIMELESLLQFLNNLKPQNKEQ